MFHFSNSFVHCHLLINCFKKRKIWLIFVPTGGSQADLTLRGSWTRSGSHWCRSVPLRMAHNPNLLAFPSSSSSTTSFAIFFLVATFVAITAGSPQQSSASNDFLPVEEIYVRPMKVILELKCSLIFIFSRQFKIYIYIKVKST